VLGLVWCRLPVAAFAADSTQIYHLPPVDVAGERMVIFNDHQITTTTTITAGQIQTLPAISLAHIFQTVPGVYVQQYGGETQLISIRGSATDHVLVLMDGRKLNSIRSGSADLSNLSLNRIAAVQIIRSGGAARWGAGALGGVINLITQRGKPQTRFTLQTGNLQQLGVYLEYQHEFDLLDMQLSGQVTQGDARPAESDFDLQNSAFTTGNVHLSLGTDHTKLQLTVSHAERGSPGTVTFPTPLARSITEHQSAQLSTVWDDNIPVVMFSQLNGVMSVGRQLSTYRKQSDAPKFQHDHLRWEVGLEQSVQFSDSIALFAGINSQWDQLKSTTDGDPARASAAVFFEYRHSWAGIKMLGALRTVLTPEYPVQWSPQFGMRRQLGWVWLLGRFQIERAVKLPDFDDLFWTQSGLAQGNPNLQPERALNLDGGVIAYLTSNLRLEVGLFQNRIDQWIQWSNTGAGIWRPSNLARAEIRGIETQFYWQQRLAPLVSLVISGNYTYLDPRNRSGERTTHGKILVRRPQHLSSGQVQLLVQNHTLTLDYNGVGRRPLNAANFHWLAGYDLWHVKLDLQWSERVRSALTCRNLTNQHYADFQYVPMPGREWLGELQFIF